MLSHLTVRNLALIDSAELSLSPGMTVLTGETGAGKSILVEALLLLLGGRASADVVRSGADEGAVQAQWQLAGPVGAEVGAVLQEQGLPPLEDGALVLRRLVSREGRHKQFINGTLCTVAQLKAVAEPLVDFTGQHAHQQLLRAGAALKVLDGFGGHDDVLRAMKAAWSTASSAAQELATLREREQEKERRLDLIRFYLDEIEALSPEIGEDERLAAEARRLRNAARLREAVGEARGLLVDGEGDALTHAQQALVALKRAARDDADLMPLCRTLEEGVALLDDVARGLQRAGAVQDDPARLAEVEDRLDALQRVSRKHGGTLESVLRAGDELRAERDAIEGAGARIEELTRALAAATRDADEIASTLHGKRKAVARKLASSMAAELPALGMATAQVDVVVEPLSASDHALLRRSDGTPLTSSGADRVEILFSANAGEPVAPLSKVASGGELSRVLLALKRVLLVRDPVPVSIFDEVDAGVGGAVGEAIGEKLEAIGVDGRQVLCITHLPQIACRARTHLHVEKGVEGGRTVSRVRVLDDAARIEELSRMLGGKEITEATRRHAEEMLVRARASSVSVSSSSGPPGDGNRAARKVKKSA